MFLYSNSNNSNGTHQSSSPDYLNMSLDYQFGLNGSLIDYAKSAECAWNGHAQGDLNCTYLLATCYESGQGVPRDYEKSLELAHLMVSRGFAPGYEVLASAYASGHGVPLDVRKMNDYVYQVVRELMHPAPGVNEEIRYEALLTAQLLLTPIDYYKMERIAREYLAASRLPLCYTFLSMALLGQVESNPSVKEEVRQLLDAGCRRNDLWSLWMTAMVMQTEALGIYQEDAALALQMLRRATASGLPDVFMRLALSTDNQQEFANMYERFWQTCNHGLSCIPRSDALPCSIRVQPSPISCGWRVCERSVAHQNLSQERLGNLVMTFPPVITLKNEGGTVLQNLSVRICCKDKELDQTISIPQSLSPSEELEVDPDDYQLDLGEDLYVEVWSGRRYACMELGNLSGLSLFSEMNPVPPFVLWWEKGFFGGYILKLACISGTLTQVEVRKGVNFAAVASVGTLRENQDAASVGWMEFSDNTGLSEGENFIVVSNEFAPVIARIFTSNDDQGSAGWVSVAKVAGLSFLGGLLDS